MNFFVFESGLAEHNAAVKRLDDWTRLSIFWRRFGACFGVFVLSFGTTFGGNFVCRGAAQTKPAVFLSLCLLSPSTDLKPATVITTTQNIFWGKKRLLEVKFPWQGKVIFHSSHKNTFFSNSSLHGKTGNFKGRESYFPGRYALRGEHVCFPGEANIHFSGIFSNFRPEARNCLSPTRSATRNSDTKRFWK